MPHVLWGVEVEQQPEWHQHTRDSVELAMQSAHLQALIKLLFHARPVIHVGSQLHAGG